MYEPAKAMNLGIEEDEEWQCLSCYTLLKLEDVSIGYINGHFTVELPCCTGCGMALVIEDIAPGKKLTESVLRPEALGLQESLLSR